MLGHLRLGSSSALGRRFPEHPHPYRNDFQRDRDRVIHSRAFRRLEGKTQVFAMGSGDHTRNRLTHTVEVSQVARTVATVLGLNEEYSETLALAHDLGHPPFGHVGEQELNRQMQRFGSGFEHNLHALRIVDLLEERYPNFRGLNLTFEVREGIVKHSREILFEPFLDENLRDFLPGKRPVLEAQLIDLADEIAYNSADLDDAFDAGLITLDDLREAVPQVAGFIEAAKTRFPGVSERIRFWEVQRNIMNLLIGGLIEGTVTAARESGVETSDGVRALANRLARFSLPAAAVSARLKTFLIERAYSSPQLAAHRQATVAQLRELFGYLLDFPERLSPGYREQLEKSPPFRVVCDYIAGMTDSYLSRVYGQLIGNRDLLPRHDAR